MARTPAQAKALEAKALKEDNKSEGMRMLLTEGYSVQEVRTVFGAPYGFVYGVAKRAGLIETTTTPRAPKEKAEPKAKAAPAAKATKATAAKTTASAKPAPRARVARTARGKATAKA